MPETNSENYKKQSNNQFFEAVWGLNGTKKSKFPKNTSRVLTKCTYQI